MDMWLAHGHSEGHRFRILSLSVCRVLDVLPGAPSVRRIGAGNP